MSAFLGPIHYWLYNKIKLMEDIEKEIVKTLDTDPSISYTAKTQEEIAPFLPSASLEDLIDTGNIHGWLQEKITKTETRQALLIKKLVDAKGDTIYETVDHIYENFGRQSAEHAFIEKPDSLETIFNKLNDYLLEGMPCDRVNQMVESTENTLSWLTTQCVHTKNWTLANIEIERYYEFRASFIKGFVEGADASLQYKYTNDGQQMHIITKEV